MRAASPRVVDPHLAHCAWPAPLRPSVPEPMPNLRDLLADGRVHVVDGAMGTMLYGRGVFLNVLLRRAQPAPARAGAGNPPGVRPGRRRGAGDQHLRRQPAQAGAATGWPTTPSASTRAAARLAREARRRRAACSAPIGPLGVRIEPFGELSVDEAAAISPRQVRGLLEGGVDGFILETFSDVDELGAALRGRPRAVRPPGRSPR